MSVISSKSEGSSFNPMSNRNSKSLKTPVDGRGNSNFLLRESDSREDYSVEKNVLALLNLVNSRNRVTSDTFRTGGRNHRESPEYFASREFFDGVSEFSDEIEENSAHNSFVDSL